MFTLKNTTVTSDRRLDRVVQFDERSRLFPVSAVLPPKNPRSYTWGNTLYLDQGNEGACVGFGWTHELAARPVVINGLDNNFARNAVYKEAQKVDEWPGENYEGTSVIAGAKVIQSLGYIKEYRWAFGLQDVVMTLGYAGPVVLGINWYNAMFKPDADGFIHYGGGLAGGHCILARGVHLVKKDRKLPQTFDNLDLDKSYVLLHNSWSAIWGIGGCAKLSLADLDALLKEDGEACVPLRRETPDGVH